ncbi:MAG: maleylpyruvate isomerase family mycothiol-dependent enzyme [Actinobacteria bacterium]|nr:maleylpyruvate isomerase family mycothiol-dependent enzyme [Actinomycetota bacterium]
MTSAARDWITALRNSHERLVSLVKPLGPGELTGRSYDSEWSVAQVLSHLGSGAEIAQLTLAAALSGTSVDRDAYQPVWDSWNAKAPQEQAADCLSADEAHVSRLEQLTDAELGRVRYEFAGQDLDAAGLVRMRLSEHALHTWDVAVALDPAAGVAPDAVALLMSYLPTVARWAGGPAGEQFQVRLRGSGPGTGFLLTVAESVTLAPGQDGTGAPEIGLPDEALLRLVYGRLDPAHTPPEVTGDPADLDRVRAVFPGF